MQSKTCERKQEAESEAQELRHVEMEMKMNMLYEHQRRI